MPPKAAQTINESVQVWKNRCCDSSNCFSSLTPESSHQLLQTIFENVFRKRFIKAIALRQKTIVFF